MKQRRDEWRDGQPTLDPARLVFVDETWASTNLTRTHGRCPLGQRLVMAVPHGHWQTTTFVAALRCDGLTAPTVVDGAMTGDLFVASVAQQLVPALRPGDIVVMDNLACPKRAGVRAAIQRVLRQFGELEIPETATFTPPNAQTVLDRNKEIK